MRMRLSLGYLTFGLLLYASALSNASSQSLEFPIDEGIHDDVDFESWVLFTHLLGADSSRYRFAVFFVSGSLLAIPVNGVYVFVANETEQEASQSTMFVIPFINRATHTRGRLQEQYGDNTLVRPPSGDPYRIVFDMDDSQVALTFAPQKAAVDLGRIAVGRDRFARSYTIPRGHVAGEIRTQEERSHLEGVGMFQHLWGDSPQQDAASDMYAIHLDNGTDIVAFHSTKLRQVNRLMVSSVADSIVFDNDFLAVADSSAAGGEGETRFPLGRTLHSEKAALDLTMRPRGPGQEARMLGVSYWVQTCSVSGIHADSSVTGDAYIYVRGLTVP